MSNTNVKYQEYQAKRQALINQTKSHLYTQFPFSEKEQKANQIWNHMLQADRHERNHTYYHTYTLRHRQEYEQSAIFNVLSQIPKGAVHHIHVDCCIDHDWFINECAYNGNCYLNKELNLFCWYKNDEQAKAGYVNCLKLREQFGAEACNADIRSRLAVTQQEAENFNADIWEAFESKILCFSGFFYNKHMWAIYLRKVFKNFIAEGITRIEARAFVGWLKDDDEQPVPTEVEFEIYTQAIKDTQQFCPDFTFGMIIQGLKVWDTEECTKYYRQAFALRKQYPHIVKAFDMVQEEDAFKTSLQLAEVFVHREEFEKEFGIDFPFVFHGGESADSQLNTNLYDVLLLDTKRIGHGINLVQHSHLIEQVKKQNICLELCVLSNQVLRYVNDLRLHPLRSFLNSGVAVTLSPDDPGYFGAKAINHDFYHATIGSRLSLQDLKQLAYNSVYHSLINQEEKDAFWNSLQQKWNNFIDWFLNTYDNQQHLNALQSKTNGVPNKKFL